MLVWLLFIHPSSFYQTFIEMAHMNNVYAIIEKNIMKVKDGTIYYDIKEFRILQLMTNPQSWF